MAEVYGPNRGIMVESSLPNVAQRHQFAQDEKAESIIIKPDDTAATAPDQQLEPPPHTPATSFNSEDLSSASPITVTSPIRLHHLQSYPANVSSPTANTDDVRHEEEDSAGTMTRSSLGEDPYVYSDDSASLSDAYFFPQPDDEHLARPPRYRTEVNSEATQTALLQYPLADYYGSMPSSSAVQVRATSPMWIAGSIQEDSEMSSSLGNPDVTSLRLHSANNDPRMKRRKERRQRRHRIHSRGILRQNSRNRELAVTAVRGRLQDPTKAHDVLWAVLFLLQLLVVFLCAIRFGCSLLYSGPETVTNSNVLHWRHIVPWHMQSSADAFTTQSIIQKAQFSDDFVVSPADATSLPPVARFSFTIDYKNVIALVSISGAYSCVITYLSYGFMLVLARALIQIMLIFSVLLALAWGLIGLTLDPYGVISIMGFTALLLTLGYAMYNWSSIPFAATNLYTALCAMRCTADITVLGFLCLLVAFTWCVVWGMASIGIVNSLNNAECDTKDACGPHVANRHIPFYLLLLFSFHWTNTVIKNITRVTVACVVGTWWFYPGDIDLFCTPVVLRPLYRSLTKSLGSICLGSLVVQPSQLLVAISTCCWCMMGNPESSCMHNHPHDFPIAYSGVTVSHGDEEVESAADSVGLHRRLCALKNRLNFSLRSCNRWSYTYIGMYGYGFAEAGERAIQLFETREWLDVVKDALIQNVLLMASLIIGGSTGTFAVVVEETDGYEFTSFHKPIISAFVIGSVIGYVLSNILLLGVVGSAVNTVLVCFAAGPFEFDKNHPRLSREMREVWSQHVWEPSL